MHQILILYHRARVSWTSKPNPLRYVQFYQFIVLSSILPFVKFSAHSYMLVTLALTLDVSI